MEKRKIVYTYVEAKEDPFEAIARLLLRMEEEEEAKEGVCGHEAQ